MKPVVSIVALVALVASLALNLMWWVAPWRGDAAARTAHDSGERMVMRTAGGVLEVSTVNAVERFDATVPHSVLGVRLGQTIASVRVPAVYRYHVPLASEWTLRRVGSTLVVIAPPVQPSLPVAIDSARIESFSAGLWAPLTGPDAIAALQRSITERLAQKAGSAELILLQREPARRTVTEFVRKWVLEQPRWKDAAPPRVLVFFEDEPLGREAAPLFETMP